MFSTFPSNYLGEQKNFFLFQIAAGRIAPEDCPRVGFLGVDSVADEFGNPCCGGCGDAGFVAVAGGESEGARDGACVTNAEGGR